MNRYWLRTFYEEVELMMNDLKKLRNYVPTPFWSQDHELWLGFVKDLKGADREILSLYPFKWAFVPATDAKTARQFLDEIGVGDVGEEAIEECKGSIPTFDDLKRDRKVDWWDGRYSEAPSLAFRMIPEWEPMAGVLLSWPIFYPPMWETHRQMIAALNHSVTFLRLPEGYLGAAVLAWLKEKGIDLNKIRPIPGPIGDIWARDYSPIYGINPHTGEAVAHKFSFTAFYPEYREQFKSIVEIDEKFLWIEGYKVRTSEILMDGGNLLTDGNGTYVMTRRVLTDNPDVRNLEMKLKSWLGAERLLIVDEEPGDVLGHICNFKFVSPKRLLVGKPVKEGTPLHRYLTNIKGMFEKLGYDVVEVPCGADFKHHLPGGDFYDYDYPGAYSNSLLLNKRVLLPQYVREDLSELNQEAIEAYKGALPGYEIFPIEATILGNGGGAINCSSKEIPRI